MKTTYELKNVPARYGRDAGNPSISSPLARSVTAAGAIRRTGLQQKASQQARAAAKVRILEQFRAARGFKYTPDTQPRDATGKFRRVLARLKTNLGDAATEQLAKELEEAESAGAIGDYAKAKEHASEVVKLVDDVDQGKLKGSAAEAVRTGAEDLGKLLAYLPLPQGDPSQKIRYSDLPEPTAKMIDNLLQRVDDKLSSEDAAKYTALLKSFKSGLRTMSADDMSAALNRLMRVLL